MKYYIRYDTDNGNGIKGATIHKTNEKKKKDAELLPIKHTPEEKWLRWLLDGVPAETHLCNDFVKTASDLPKYRAQWYRSTTHDMYDWPTIDLSIPWDIYMTSLQKQVSQSMGLPKGYLYATSTAQGSGKSLVAQKYLDWNVSIDSFDLV